MPRIPLLPRRRTRTPSRRERVVGGAILALLACAVGGFVVAGRGPGPPGLPEVAAPARTGPGEMPISSPAGWPRGPIETYDRDRLYEKINGKADAFLAYRFAGMTFASYADPASPDRYVDVYRFDMGEGLDAFGVFRAQRSGAAATPGLGEEGTHAGAAAFLRQGRYYIEAVGSSAAVGGEALALAKAVAASLPATPPVTHPPFPTQGLQAVRFDRENAMNVEGLRDAFVALYEDGARAVIADAGTAEAAGKAAAAATETFSFLGEPAAFEGHGRRVVGAAGGKDAARRTALLDALRAALPPEDR